MNEEQVEPQHQRLFLDQKDFLAEFLFNPDIKEAADYGHLDKNLASTKLSSRYGEPDRARMLLHALHTLTKLTYYYKVRKEKLVGYDEEAIDVFLCGSCANKYFSEEPAIKCECGEEIHSKTKVKRQIPIFREMEEQVSFYPKIFHTLKSHFYSLTTTAAARDGYLMRSATTAHFSREESIEDRTAVKSRWGGGNNNNNKGKRGLI